MEEKGIKRISPMELISQTDVREVQAKLSAIQKFRALVKATLQKGYDYGVIAGKPTLLKPGAEKLIVLLGLNSTFDIVDKVEDWEKGFFAYTVKCTLYYNGQVVTEGLGHANTKEANRRSKDPFSEANAVLKMAEKRALVDAALHAGALSDVFTQDLDDLMKRNNAPVQKTQAPPQQTTQPAQNPAAPPKKTISDAQIRRLYALAAGDKELIKQVVKEYGFTKLHDIPRDVYEAIAEDIAERAGKKEG